MLIGFLILFAYSCFVGFWFFHLLHLFLGLRFPFKMKTLLDSSSIRLKIHLTELVIVLLLGLLSPILTISLSFNRDSGWFCTPQSNDVVFYGIMLPQVLMFLIGLVLLFLSLWILRRVSLANVDMYIVLYVQLLKWNFYSIVVEHGLKLVAFLPSSVGFYG